MARRVYFAFDYEDVKDFRANVVRMSWVTQPDREAAGFWDAADWEKVRKQDDDAIKRWINRQMEGASVTAVLIGTGTSGRRWVNYEIIKSYEDRKGLLGIYIHNIPDKYGYKAIKGGNPFGNIYIEPGGRREYFSTIYRTYDWVADDGYKNFGNWVEDAARKARN
jgi:hypothetical protein